MKVTAIYDNGGKTLDRFTVFTDEEINDFDSHAINGRPSFNALGLGEGGDGFSQWGEAQPGSHLGRRVQFDTLSEATQKHIARRVFEVEA
jgi:hypothetical protein